MKKKIILPISKSAKILLKVGDDLSVGTKIAEEDISKNEETINLAMILSVLPKQIQKFIKVSIGQRVLIGDILAIKKSIFSSVTIKSPMTGIIKSIDLNNGSIIIGEENKLNDSTIVSSISGKVEKIEEGMVEISISGEVIKVEEGKGEEISGEVIIIDKDIFGAFDNIADINEKILVCSSIEKDTEVKLEVMGVKGFVVTHNLVNTFLPWVRINQVTYENMLKKEKVNLWLRPKNRELIIFS